MGERGSSDAPGCLGILLLIGFVALAIGALGKAVGCGGDSSDDSGQAQNPSIALLEATAEDRAEAMISKYAAHPDEWIAYSDCPSRARCRAELQYLALPGAPLGVERYAMRGRHIARTVGPRGIRTAILVDEEHDCTGLYLETESPKDLINCLLAGVEEMFRARR